MLGWKNICALTFSNTTLRAVRMWVLYTVPSVAKCPHGLDWTPLPPPPPPPRHSDFTHTNVRHAWMHVCTLTHTDPARWAKRQVSHLMKRHIHTNRLCLCRERPFYSARQCLCWLFFVCTFLSTKSSRKNGEKEVREACNRNHWHVQTYKSSPFISQSQTIFYSTIMLQSSSVPLRIWWRYIWVTNLALAHLPPLTDKRHFTLYRWWWWCTRRVI